MSRLQLESDATSFLIEPAATTHSCDAGLVARFLAELEILGRQSSRDHREASRIDAAISQWRAAIHPQHVIAQEAAAPYGHSTLGSTRRISVVLRPASADEVAECVSIANHFRIAVYPVSSGRNWGYGSASPCVDDCAVIDLSRMNRILDVNADLGTVTLEPGVTQQQLWDYLEENGLPFCVPTHGGGPDCSIVGNALERGYGITPQADHFAGLMSLEAVLADGSRYRSPLKELGAAAVDGAFKWSIGPYLDGLFSQGSFGVVTQATIALAARPRAVEAFFFEARSDADLEALVAAVRRLTRKLGSAVTSVNLMNNLRVLSMTAPYPRDRAARGCLPPAVVAELSNEYRIAAWTGAGALWGEPEVVRAARRIMKSELKPFVRRITTFGPRKLAAVGSLAKVAPAGIRRWIEPRVSAAKGFLDVVTGKPSRVALPLAYWKRPTPPDKSTALNPERDGCGLRWYAPLVPMDPSTVRQYVSAVHETCGRHAMDPLITLTSLSDRCFDSTVPLIFDRSDAEQVSRAAACYQDLFSAGQAIGAVPYRFAIDQMSKVVDPDSTFWKTVSRLKDAVDPRGIISPGRYTVPGHRGIGGSEL
jgi:FAD/FMN-containing dehydrogenase